LPQIFIVFLHIYLLSVLDTFEEGLKLQRFSHTEIH